MKIIHSIAKNVHFFGDIDIEKNLLYNDPVMKNQTLFKQSVFYFLLTGLSLLLILLSLFIVGINAIKKENRKSVETTLQFIDEKLNSAFTEIRFQLNRLGKQQAVNLLFLYDEMTPTEKNNLDNQINLIFDCSFSLENYELIASAGLASQDVAYFFTTNAGLTSAILDIFQGEDTNLVFSDRYNSFFAYQRLRNQDNNKEMVIFIELIEYNLHAYLNSLIPYSDNQSISLIHPQKVINSVTPSANFVSYQRDISSFGLKFAYHIKQSSALFSLQIFIIIGVSAVSLCFILTVIYLGIYQKRVTQPYQKLLYDQKVAALEANIKYLEAQISPHFLYNCLYSISMLAKSRKIEAIQQFATKLGTFYKYAAKNFSDNVTLDEEYECVVNYCEIQTMRFEQRIKVCMEPLPEKIKSKFVPKFSIQALVENAYSHGMKNVEQNGLIRINFHENEEYFEVNVEDNGSSLTDEKLNELQKRISTESVSKDKETGILNLSTRLKLKYQNRAKLFLQRSPLGGLSAKIHIYYEKQTERE